MKIRSISLPDDLDQALIEAARRDGRKVSDFARRLFVRGVGEITGENRQADFEKYAAACLEASAAARTRKKAPNATAVIAEASVEGHAAVRAHQKIAVGNRKAAR